MSEEQAEAPVKRGRGRPRKVPPPETKTTPKIQAKGYKWKNQPNWDDPEVGPRDGFADKYKIPKEILDRFPDLVFQWVTDSVFGQQDPQHRGEFERGGWHPVDAQDLDGVFDGLFMKRGATGDIKVSRQVLMMRRRDLHEKALRMEAMRAREQVLIKEQAWRSGEIGVT